MFAPPPRARKVKQSEVLPLDDLYIVEDDLPRPPRRFGRTTASMVSASSSSQSTVRTDAREDPARPAAPLPELNYYQAAPHRIRGTALADDRGYSLHGGTLEQQSYLRTAEGRQLGLDDSAYHRSTARTLDRAGAIRGRRVLILGCGASATLMHYARCAPAQLVLSDVKPGVAEFAAQRIRAAALGSDVRTMSIDMFQCDQAFADDEEFDLIIALKCLGQALVGGSSLTELGHSVMRIMSPDALLVVDQPSPYASLPRDRVGTRMSTLGLSEADYRVSTIAGRFDDVVYDVEVLTTVGLERVARHSAFGRRTAPVSPWQDWVQSWFRAPARALFGYPAPAAPPATRLQAFLPSYEGDSCGDVYATFDLTGMSGSKRLPSVSDARRVDPGRTCVKFDGVSCVLSVESNELVFMTPLETFYVEMDMALPTSAVMFGELLQVGRDRLCVITGLVSMAGRYYDPHSLEDLALLHPASELLSRFGVLIQNPYWTNFLATGNYVSVRGPRGPVRVPVDGLNCSIGGRLGYMMKTARHSTIDVSLAGAAETVRELRARLLFADAHPRIQGLPAHGAHPDRVVEIEPLTSDLSLWQYVRDRPDKEAPADVSQCVADCTSALTMFATGMVGDVLELYASVSRHGRASTDWLQPQPRRRGLDWVENDLELEDVETLLAFFASQRREVAAQTTTA